MNESNSHYFDKLNAAADFIKSHIHTHDFKPKLALIMGSGMNDMFSTEHELLSLSYKDIPGFTPMSVAGHSAQMSFLRMFDQDIILLRGRNHLYEGLSAHDVAFPVRTLKLLGIEDVLLTNAVGSLNESYKPGEFVSIHNHINFQGHNPLLGPNLSDLGDRFPDMSFPYCIKWQERVQNTAKTINEMILHSGVYAGVLGPSYETASEIKMLRLLGGDVVGMSTLSEVIAARHAKLNVCVISVITNYGAGILKTPLKHADVVKIAGESKPKMLQLLNTLLQQKGI